MAQPEPKVLDYASPQTNRRRRRVTDRPAFVFALLQLCVWIIILRATDSRPVFGKQESLFAWCWWYTENPTTGPLLMVLLSVMVLVTSIRPAENRAAGYRLYVIGMLFMLPLYSVASLYVVAQLPGVWGSMLHFYQHRSHPTNLGPMIFLGYSVLLVFLDRLLSGRKLQGI